MTIKVNKYVGASLLNAYRQILYTRLKETKPIACRVGNFSNVLTISDAVEESMPEFISKLSALVFSQKSGSEYYEWHGKVNGVFKACDLEDGEIKIHGDRNLELLHCHSEVEVSIIFRTTNGVHARQDNEDFISSKGKVVEEYSAFSTRHTPIVTASFSKVGETHGEIDEYNILIVTKGCETKEDVLNKASMILQGDAEGLIESLADS